MTKLLAKDLVDGQGNLFIKNDSGRYLIPVDLDCIDLMPFIQASCEAVKCQYCAGSGQIGRETYRCVVCKGTGAVIRRRKGI